MTPHIDDVDLLDLALGTSFLMDLSPGTAAIDLSRETAPSHLSPGTAATDLSREPAIDHLSQETAQAAHLAACPRCRAALAEAREAAHLLAFSLAPASPPPDLRVRLLAAVAGPLTRHAARVADLFARPVAETDALLARVLAGAARWTPLFPGIDVHPVSSAPGRDCGLIRVDAGVRFPYHRHVGEERVLIIQGSCTDSGGQELGPGDELVHAAGTGHALDIHRGQPLVFAYVTAGSEFPDLQQPV